MKKTEQPKRSIPLEGPQENQQKLTGKPTHCPFKNINFFGLSVALRPKESAKVLVITSHSVFHIKCITKCL